MGKSLPSKNRVVKCEMCVYICIYIRVYYKYRNSYIITYYNYIQDLAFKRVG